MAPSLDMHQPMAALNISGEQSGEGSGPRSSQCMPPSVVAKKLGVVGSPLIGPEVAQASAGPVAAA